MANLKNDCLKCDGDMVSIGKEQIQLGKASPFWGTFNNLLSGSLEVEIFQCDKCSKIEFYSLSNLKESPEISKIRCPECDEEHDLDCPKCPKCGHDYCE